MSNTILTQLSAGWSEIEPSTALRTHAKRFLNVHDLRAADALQLAAAFIAAEGQPSLLEFVCFDERLLAAANPEGFQVISQR